MLDAKIKEVMLLRKLLLKNNIDISSIAMTGKGIIPGYTTDVLISEIMGIKIIEKITANND